MNIAGREKLKSELFVSESWANNSYNRLPQFLCFLETRKNSSKRASEASAHLILVNTHRQRAPALKSSERMLTVSCVMVFDVLFFCLTGALSDPDLLPLMLRTSPKALTRTRTVFDLLWNFDSMFTRGTQPFLRQGEYHHYHPDPIVKRIQPIIRLDRSASRLGSPYVVGIILFCSNFVRTLAARGKRSNCAT